MESVDEPDTMDAYHEAGHCALTLYYGGSVQEATAKYTCTCCAGTFRNNGITYYESLERVYEAIRILCAGYVAVAIHEESDEGEAAILTGSEDMERVTDLKRRFQIPDAQIGMLEQETTALVRELWELVDNIAQLILVEGAYRS